MPTACLLWLYFLLLYLLTPCLPAATEAHRGSSAHDHQPKEGASRQD